jgi:hypothetical protein
MASDLPGGKENEPQEHYGQCFAHSGKHAIASLDVLLGVGAASGNHIHGTHANHGKGKPSLNS